jgi:hypothetical protein
VEAGCAAPELPAFAEDPAELLAVELEAVPEDGMNETAAAESVTGVVSGMVSEWPAVIGVEWPATEMIWAVGVLSVSPTVNRCSGLAIDAAVAVDAVRCVTICAGIEVAGLSAVTAVRVDGTTPDAG